MALDHQFMFFFLDVFGSIEIFFANDDQTFDRSSQADFTLLIHPATTSECTVKIVHNKHH